MNNDFLPQQGHYENLAVFKIARCIYAITFHFAHRFLEKGDRTIDQMVQAARSGKQNIAEGSKDGATSKEMELKLTNVAKASMHELLQDYEDYLLLRRLQKWPQNDPRAIQTREFCRHHNAPEDYLDKLPERNDETIANIAITLLHQYDYLITRLIETQKQRFLKEGGIKEEMYRARTAARGTNWSSQRPQSPQSPQSSQNSQSSQRPQSPQSSRSSQSSQSSRSSRSSQSSQSSQSSRSSQRTPENEKEENL